MDRSEDKVHFAHTESGQARTLMTEVPGATELWRAHRYGWTSPAFPFVHHLHGVWSEPRSLVFDANDYRDLDGESRFPLKYRLRQSDEFCIFVGIGASIFDDHFS